MTGSGPVGTDAGRTEAVLAGLESWLDERSPSATHAVVDHASPATGYSSETMLVDTRRTEGGETYDERIVLKLAPSGPAIFERYDFVMQARVQQEAGAAGVPTASPVIAESGLEWMGVPFMVMPAVEGHIFGEVSALDRLLTGAGPAANSALHSRYIDLVADINRIDWRGVGLDAAVPRRDNAAEVDRWRSYLAWYAEGAELVPALTAALDWCEAHRPPSEPDPSLLWGDVRLENIIVDDDREPVAVLDWEMATIGAAEHDLAWALALQTVQDELVHRTVPGFLDHDACVERYESRLGRSVRDLGWYEIFAVFRSTAIMSRIAHLNDLRGEPNFYPVADNPVLDLLGSWIDEATSAG